MADPTPEQLPVVTPFYLDKGAWAMVLTPVFLLLNQKFGIALDPVAIIGFVLPVVSYIVMHKWKTATIQAAQAAGAAAGAAVDSPAKALGVVNQVGP